MNDERTILVFFAAGEPDAAEALAGQLGAEPAILEESPGAVVLCGSGPEVGAAALVAAKLGVALARVTAGTVAADDPAALADLDGPVAERLADLAVPGGDDAQGVAEAIRAGLASYTLTP